MTVKTKTNKTNQTRISEIIKIKQKRFLIALSSYICII